jgi:protein TonB
MPIRAITADAMRAKVQGSVWLECIVLPDGTVGDVRITRSLDSRFGLDEEAIAAARRWRFKPGLLNGRPVPVAVTIELMFSLR